MDKLFAPWRASYITAGLKKEEGCPFCRIQALPDNEENLILWRGNKTFSVLNRFPYTNGHSMIVLKQHGRSFLELSDEESTEIFREAQLVLKILKEDFKPDGFNLGFNFGKVAGAGIEEHLHFHIVPRWNGDTNFMPVFADVRVISEALEESYKKIKNGYLRNKNENH